MSLRAVPPMKRSQLPAFMVVDDEAHVLESIHDQFRLQYRVSTFETPREALAALDAVDPAVVLSDQRMPGMTGVNFLREVKLRRPDASRLLFTGYADINAVIDAINEGNVYRYINKPWNSEEMDATIRQAVERHRLLVERRSLMEELQATNARLREADDLKKAFIEVASHELNTPVAVILGMADLWKMMRESTQTAPERAWLDRIHGAGRRLAQTVERMLKFLRADHFDEPLAAEPTDLETLVRNAVADVAPFLEARHQEARIEIAEGLGHAELDPAKIGDVLTNLLVNAIKFTPDGGRITVIAGPQDDDRVRFQIVDTGMGISPADHAHLFEPFFTGYDTLHHSSGEYQFGKKGIGLGLSLVKSFVELHGGSVEFVSSPASGSTFGFTLPRRLPGRIPTNGRP